MGIDFLAETYDKQTWSIQSKLLIRLKQKVQDWLIEIVLLSRTDVALVEFG